MTIVETTNGKVEGVRVDGVHVFYGIPYAAPPVGPLRLRHPVAHPGWSGVRDATVHGPASLQVTPGRGVEGDEDCLQLNVFTAGSSGPPRPTMVWFHGGAFSSGAGWLEEYDGMQLARSHDVVVVTCNYRLGVLGWLYTEPQCDAFDANCGLYDQLAALQWVQQNIMAFGGDPTNVTAFGQSAGATSIVALATMPEGRGLFHRIIAQSGSAERMLDTSEACELTDELVNELGNRTDVTSLRSMAADRLLDAQQRVTTRHAWVNLVRPTTQRLFVFGPVADGRTLDPQRLNDLRRPGPIPLVVGSNQDEWRAFATRIDNPPSEQAILDDLATWVTDARAVWDFYRSRASDVRDAWTALSTDCLFTIPAIRLADAWRQHSPASTYHYLFRWKPPLSGNGAAHSREIPFVFNTFHHRRGHMLGGFSPPLSLLRLVQGSWAAFAHSGAPSSTLEWPAYGPDRSTMVLDAVSEVVDDPLRERRQLWDRVRTVTG